MISRIDIEDMTDAQDEAPWVAVWLRFAENGNIRKWDREPFPDGEQYVHGSLFRSALSERDEARAEVNRLTAARPSQAGDERVARLVKAAKRVAWVFPCLNQTETDAMGELEAALAAMDTPKGGGDE